MKESAISFLIKKENKIGDRREITYLNEQSKVVKILSKNTASSSTYPRGSKFQLIGREIAIRP